MAGDRFTWQVQQEKAHAGASCKSKEEKEKEKLRRDAATLSNTPAYVNYAKCEEYKRSMADAPASLYNAWVRQIYFTILIQYTGIMLLAFVLFPYRDSFRDAWWLVFLVGVMLICLAVVYMLDMCGCRGMKLKTWPLYVQAAMFLLLSLTVLCAIVVIASAAQTQDAYVMLALEWVILVLVLVVSYQIRIKLYFMLIQVMIIVAVVLIGVILIWLPNRSQFRNPEDFLVPPDELWTLITVLLLATLWAMYMTLQLSTLAKEYGCDEWFALCFFLSISVFVFIVGIWFSLPSSRREWGKNLHDALRVWRRDR